MRVRVLNAYPCSKCGDHFVPSGDENTVKERSEYDGLSYPKLLCDVCKFTYTHSLNTEGLATIIHRGAE
jgi:hypothetical protein